MRTILVMIVAAAALAIPDTAANARGSRDTRTSPDAASLVACPASTCNPRGGPRARNINVCKASNCRK